MGNKKNNCYKNLKESQLDCLKNSYSAIVILDGKEYQQLTSHIPKFPFLDSELPVVTISYLDQEKVPNLASPGNTARGSVLINSIDKILDAKDTFNFTCDESKCIRFVVLYFVKASLFVYHSVEKL